LSSASDIVLSTLNARYIHSAFGLRYLAANMGPLRAQTTLIEFDINQNPLDIAEALLALSPKILGLSVYIWNAEPMRELVSLLKRISPSTTIVLGGPEISHETEAQALTELVDYVVCGEGDVAFAALCTQILDGARPEEKIIRPTLPDLTTLVLPYEEYTAQDCMHRVVYVEASRGCPYSCEFCLSSLDEKVRAVPLDTFLQAMTKLAHRGVRHFKLVDRTFNLNIETSRRILEFFLAMSERVEGLFVHFEMIPDRLPDALREVIARFPMGALQFEVGVQTLAPMVEKNISRRQKHDKLAENFRYLREHTGVHIHADLIVGLPGETLASFAQGFDTLFALGPHEIQVGILKRLRGTPIARHDRMHRMIYSPTPPYEVLQTGTIPFATMQALRRFARYWDLFFNSGRFPQAMAEVMKGGSPFERFYAFSQWLHTQLGRLHGVSFNRQIELCANYLRDVCTLEEAQVRAALVADYQRTGKKDELPWLFGRVPEEAEAAKRRVNRRQGRHAGQDVRA
jgi:radical SAM superfamily enzyme YgiQ (UPF0313 family)